MNSAEAEDTGVFSPDNRVHRNKKDLSESDGTNVFSPDILSSRLIESPSSPGSKENTPSTAETPVTKQLEDFDKKNVERKRYFYDALNTSNLDNDSCNQSVEEDSLDNFEKQINNEKRAKRFRLSLEVPSNDSNSDDIGVGSSASQEENRNERKNRFVVSLTQEKDDSTYSDLFKSASQGESNKRQRRFIAPPSFVESDDSLLLSNVFKSSSKDKKRGHNFKVPKSPLGSQDSERYSDVFKSKSRDGANKNRKPRFVLDPRLQESCDSSQYSDISKSISHDEKKKIRELRFLPITSSQDSCDSLHYSDILKSTPREKETKRKDRFIIPSCSQDTEDSRQYSEIFESVSKNVKKTDRNNHFAVLSFQDCEDSSHYSDVSVEQKGGKKYHFDDPTSQGTDDSLRYSDISISQNKTEVENDPTVDSNSQEIGETSQSSDVSIVNEENANQGSRFENSYDRGQRKYEKTSSTVSTSIRSICIDTIRSSLSIEKDENINQETIFENANDEERTEKSSSAASLYVRSVCVDTMRSSLNLSDLPSISKEASKPFNLTYDVSTSAFCIREDASSLVNVNAPNLDEIRNYGSLNNVPVIPSLNASNDQTQENANESATLLESKDENSSVHESISATTDRSKDESSFVHESIPMTDESKNESFYERESVSVSDKSENENTTRKSVSGFESISNFKEDSKGECNEVVESNVTSAVSVQSIMIDTIPNSSNASLTIEKVVEESTYVAFNPSSLMFSVTEIVEAPSNSVDNVSNRSENLLLPNNSPSGETFPAISVPAIALKEDNIKEHDYAMVHVTNAEEAVSEIVIDCVGVSSVQEILTESTTKEIITSNSVEIVEEPVATPMNARSSGEISQEFNAQKEAQESECESNSTPCVEKIINKQDKTLVDVPRTENMPKSIILLPSNDELITKKKSPLSSTFTQSANSSLRTRKSLSNVSNEQNITVDSAILPSSSPSTQQRLPNKSSASVSQVNVVQPYEESIASNALLSKSNYSLRSRNSRSSVGQKSSESIPMVAEKSPEPLPVSVAASVQKTPEPVPSTSAPNFNNDRLDGTGDAFLNFSNSINEIPSRNSSEIRTQAGSYFSRSRNLSTSHTFGSKSSVSVFSISKIGRRSSALKEFKVPQVPKVVSKKKKKSDQSFQHLPSRPNFPKFDFYCNKRFYDYLTSKMEPKYGIRTNIKAVKLAKYISEVVKEVISTKTGRHHILIEEMKKVLFSAGIVTTHYNFYMYCFDYLPPWFRRKAIPMMCPVDCPPNVDFDISIVFDSIG